MPRNRDDDLFSEGASMSFGDHLEELRTCLLYAIGWLIVGVCFGFIAGGYVLDYIQIPLTAALEKYHLDQGTNRLTSLERKLIDEGQPPEIVRVPAERGLVPTEFWIFPGELERALAYQKRQQKALAETGRPLLELDEVDNFTAAKRARAERWKKQASESRDLLSHEAKTDYRSDPVRLLLWTEIKDSALVRSKSFNAQETFGIYIKASILAGFVLASPGIFYHLWAFVAAGLYPHERRYIYIFMPISIVLFLMGAVFAFFVVFRFILDFLFWFNAWTNIQPEARINEWLSFALLLPVGFGISFQLPLVMFVLERVHIFSVDLYVRQWRISVLVIFIISMLLTPADPWSMILMAIPLTFLYFGGILICKMFPRKELYAETGEVPAD